MFEIPSLDLQVLAVMLLIFCLRIVDVSMGTIRMLMIMRGMRKWAVLIGFVEVTIWVVAISQVMSNLNNLWNILAYSGGFATGTYIGMYLENGLAMGSVDIRVVSLQKGAEIVSQVRKAGYGATELPALGRSGPVSLIGIVVTRKQKPAVLALITEVDPDAFVTVDDMRRVDRGYGRLAK
ncbi:MAG: DUF2179 domain-containing protein [Caldilineaceae bacterium]